MLAITSCNTDTQAAIDVHSPITIQMSPKDFSPTVFILKKPRNFEWYRLKTRCMQRINMERQDSAERPGNQDLRAARTGVQLPQPLCKGGARAAGITGLQES